MLACTLQLVHDLPEEAAGRGHKRQDVAPQASRLVDLRVLAEEADILEGNRDARSFEALAPERAQELIVLVGVFRPAVGEHRIKEAPAARVEPKGGLVLRRRRRAAAGRQPPI